MPSVPARPAEPELAAGRTADPLIVVRYLDVVILVLAAPFVVLLGAPVLGYAAAAAAWIALRIAGAVLERHVARKQDPRAVLGLTIGSSVVRVWLIGLTILAVGLLAEREDGLAAGITVLVAFTVYFATALILRPLERKPTRS
jgi:peptidoglycan biosynthesis protein MviN/MurJ (putative lipid II flippase)